MNQVQNQFDLMFTIYTILLSAIILGVIIGVMITAKKRYRKNMDDDNMKLTEGYNNGKVILYRPDLKKNKK
jgi:heme/copper-type cytochrome/quinol oxidase subunit 2